MDDLFDNPLLQEHSKKIVESLNKVIIDIRESHEISIYLKTMGESHSIYGISKDRYN